MRRLTEQDLVERAARRDERARRWRVRFWIFLLVAGVAAAVWANLQ